MVQSVLMPLLKPIRTDFQHNARSEEVALAKYSYDDEKKMYGKDHYYTKQALEALETARKEFKAQGDAVRVTPHGLPLPGLTGKGWVVSWMLKEEEYRSSSELPFPLTFSEESLSKNKFDSKRYSIWLYQDRVYLADGAGFAPEDIRALINQDANKRRLALAKAHALEAMTADLDRPRQREKISQDVRVEVWQRDGGRCVECGSQEHLEFDHIIPFAMGGANTARNLQLLCGDCNRRKGMTLG